MMQRHWMRAWLMGLALTSCRCDPNNLQDDKAQLKTPVAPLDFGPVPEGMVGHAVVTLENVNTGILKVTASLAATSSAEFTLTQTTLSLTAGTQGTLALEYRPAGQGEDVGTLVLETNDDGNKRVEVAIHGGPIAPLITANPSPLTFPNAVNYTETGAVVLRNEGPANLHIRSVGVAPGGNPDFSVNALGTEVVLRQQETLVVRVTYSRSLRNTQGTLLVLSDDMAHPSLQVPLIPTPLGQCGDNADNDQDGMTDYPDDPGCTDVNDNDETDPPACLDGATLRCGTDVGACHAGLRTCAASHFGNCVGAVGPVDEVCDGVDNDCDGLTDEFLDNCGTSSSSTAATSASRSSSGPVASSASSASSGPAPSSSAVSSSSAAMCQTPADCMNTVDNSAGCYLLDCVNGACQATLRHDSPSWHVGPHFTDELLIGNAGSPRQALWDGHDFMVIMTLAGLGTVGRRISTAGAIVDNPAFSLDPNYSNIAFAGDRYLVVTNETGSGVEANPPQYDYVGGYFMSRTGGMLGAKQVLLSDNGSSCAGGLANMAGADVSAGANSFLVLGSVQCGFILKGLILDTAGGRIPVPPVDFLYRPRYGRGAAGPGGFVAVTEDNWIGAGGNEVWAGNVTGGGFSQYGVVQPHLPGGVENCCVQSLNVMWGGSTYLFTYDRDQLSAQLMTTGFVPGVSQVPPVAPVVLEGRYPNYVPPEMGFDGTNFLVVSKPDLLLHGVRITQAGALLDTVPINLTPSDALTEDTPQLASNGAGRWLIAYAKGGATYVRLFSTCP